MSIKLLHTTFKVGACSESRSGTSVGSITRVGTCGLPCMDKVYEVLWTVQGNLHYFQEHFSA